MSGETNLQKLLSSMSPKLVNGEFVFCTVKDENYGDFAEISPLASFQEEEGLTLVLSKEIADSMDEVNYEGIFRCITLNVHSSLDAVGLTAAVASKLTEHDISANVIAAYYHDHIFVPKSQAEKALLALDELVEHSRLVSSGKN